MTSARASLSYEKVLSYVKHGILAGAVAVMVTVVGVGRVSGLGALGLVSAVGV
jgi:hypothetical protein